MAKEDVKREGWSADELGEQSSYEDENEIGRRMRRGDETAGDPNERDVAGAVPEEDTAHVRETRGKHKPAKKDSNKESPDEDLQ